MFVTAAVLLLPHRAENEQLRIGANLRHEQVLLPLSTPDKSRFVVVDYAMVEDEERGAGILILFDDARTNREVDYIELYDVDGSLLMVSWIDRFGICQIAIDRGLLEDEEDAPLEGVLVLVPGGTPL